MEYSKNTSDNKRKFTVQPVKFLMGGFATGNLGLTVEVKVPRVPSIRCQKYVFFLTFRTTSEFNK